MRLASVILGIMLAITASFQTVALVGVSAFSDRFDTEALAGTLFLLAVLVGAAFAYGVPIVGAKAFAVAAVIGIAGASTTEFDDLYIWGAAALLVCAVTVGGAYEKGKVQDRSRMRDDLLIALVNEVRSLRLVLSEERTQENTSLSREHGSVATTQQNEAGGNAAHPAAASGTTGDTRASQRGWARPESDGSGTAVNEKPRPVITVLPENASAGAEVTAIAQGYRPDTRLYLAWVDQLNGARVVGQRATDVSGAARFTFQVPAVPPGTYRVVSGAPGEPQASALVTVQASPSTGVGASAAPATG